MIVSASLFPKTDSVFPGCTPDGKPEREHNVTAIALMVIGLLLFVVGALLLLLWAPPSQPCLIVSSCCLGAGTVLIGSGVGKSVTLSKCCLLNRRDLSSFFEKVFNGAQKFF